jgi:hypothetical protein
MSRQFRPARAARSPMTCAFGGIFCAGIIVACPPCPVIALLAASAARHAPANRLNHWKLGPPFRWKPPNAQANKEFLAAGLCCGPSKRDIRGLLSPVNSVMAGLSGYKARWDRVPGGWPMREVLLIDVALWGALIMMAALIIIRRWRRRHSWMPDRGPYREAPEPAGQKMPPPQTASVTGLGGDTREPDGAIPRPARPAPAAPPQATERADPKARPHQPGTQRDDRQAPSWAASPTEQIASYYDQADQQIADYLAALGWAQQPAEPPVRQYARNRVPPQNPRAARPAP